MNNLLDNKCFKVEWPDWLDRSIDDFDEDLRFEIEISAPEKRILKKKKKLNPGEWVLKYRPVTHGPHEGNLITYDLTPYAPEIIDSSFYPSVREIVLCFAAQTAKSTIIDSCLYYTIDNDPSDILSIYPDRETCKENNKDRWQKAIRQSSALRKYMTGSKDDISLHRIDLEHMVIYMGWSGSSTKLANKTMKYIDAAEVDKYEVSTSKKEGGIMDYIRLRKTYYKNDYKMWISSTPTIETGNIWIELNSSTIFDYEVKCPGCDEYHVMKFENIQWPKGEDGRSLPYNVINDRFLAFYTCPLCGDRWDDLRRDNAVKNGRWIHRETEIPIKLYLQQNNPVKIGFHLPGWNSAMVSLSECAADYLKFKQALNSSEKRKARQHFYNSRRADASPEIYVDVSEAKFHRLKTDYPAAIIPGGGQVAAITCGADRQDNGIYYVIRAWGYGVEQESWLIANGFVLDEDQLNKIIKKNWQDNDKLYYMVGLTVLDSGGHNTLDVYKFARKNPTQVVAAKGAKGRRATPITWSRRDYYPGTKEPIPGGLQLCRYDKHHYKDLLEEKLLIAPGDPGAWYLNADASDDYIKQLASVGKDENNLWKKEPGKHDHYHDCETYAFIGADVLQVWAYEK